MTGIVEKYDRKKGFGFIKNNDGKRTFVIYKAVKIPFRHYLKPGEKVAYYTAPGSRGLQAVKVRLVKDN